MVEFEMEKDEAVTDAIEQFKQQGVDLAGIDISGALIRDDGTVEVCTYTVDRMQPVHATAFVVVAVAVHGA